MIWDWLRLLAFIEAAVIWGFTLAIFRLYHARYRQALSSGTGGRRGGTDRRSETSGRRARPRGFDTPWIGLLPLHVWLVSIGTLVLVGSECALVTRNIGRTPEWYGLPAALAGFTILSVSLAALARHEHRLIH